MLGLAIATMVVPTVFVWLRHRLLPLVPKTRQHQLQTTLAGCFLLASVLELVLLVRAVKLLGGHASVSGLSRQPTLRPVFQPKLLCLPIPLGQPTLRPVFQPKLLCLPIPLGQLTLRLLFMPIAEMFQETCPARKNLLLFAQANVLPLSLAMIPIAVVPGQQWPLSLAKINAARWGWKTFADLVLQFGPVLLSEEEALQNMERIPELGMISIVSEEQSRVNFPVQKP